MANREKAAANVVSLAMFLAIVLGGGLLIGYLTGPGQWYAGLEKPFFNPPAWVFAPVWTILYILIAVAGWRMWRQARTAPAMVLWWVQLGLNFLWSPIFFGARMPETALIVILLLLVAILAFIVTGWRQDRLAAALFAPYAAWVGFASLLNGAIAMLN